MTEGEVDGLLGELAEVATTLLHETAAAERDRDKWSDASEAFVEGPPGARQRPDPRRALVNARRRAAVALAGALRRDCQEMVAWWAHAATYAAAATTRGATIDPIMIAAADPTAYFDEDDLARLPSPPESQRSLAILAAHMATTTIAGEQPGEMARIARDTAAQAGLLLTADDDGEPAVIDDVFPDGRRCRMWGWLWSELRLPALPRADELIEFLGAAHPPETVMDEIRSAAAAVEEVIAAELRLHELETDDSTDDPAAGAEFNRLLAQVDRTTDVIADYARVLTAHLPALRRTPR